MNNVVPFKPRPRRLSLLPGQLAPGLPQFVQQELGWGFNRAFPRQFCIPCAPQSTYLRYTVQPFAMVDEEDGVLAKQLTGWIMVQGEPAGMIQMDEWTPLPDTGDRMFFDACDGWSQATAEFGHAVFAKWKIRRLAAVGPLVELSRVWMRPEYAQKRLWALAVKELIRRRYANRFSILLLNAWPADWKAEHINQEGWRGSDEWDRRRTSIQRLAQAALDVQPVPVGGELMDRWWCWKALSAGVPRPSNQRR